MHSKHIFLNWNEALINDALSGFWADVDESVYFDSDHTLEGLGWSLGCDWTETEAIQYFDLAEKIRSEKFQYVLLIGLGGSSAGAKAIVSLGEDSPKFIFVDSIIPLTLQKIIEEVRNQKILLLICSKSGTTLETVILARYFLGQLGPSLRLSNGTVNAIAITDHGTFLEELAFKYNFRNVITSKVDIGGRFSELSSFGLFPALLNKSDVSSVMVSATRMVSDSRDSGEQNPVVPLVDYLGVNLVSGVDKLYVYLPPSLRGFSVWLEQLLSESLGKSGIGIIPIIGDAGLMGNSEDICCVLYEDSTSLDPSLVKLEQSFENRSIPVFKLKIDDSTSLGGEFYRWKLAVVLLAKLLDINPFNQPQVQKSKDNTNEIIEYFTVKGRLPPTSSTLSLSEWISHIKNDGYVAILPFVHMEDKEQELLFHLGLSIRQLTGVHVTLASGPSYLHSTGQMHKGGPQSGAYLQLLSTYHDEIPVDGETYTMSTLLAAQANGDMESLVTLGRPVCRVDLGFNIEGGLRNLINEVKNMSR